MQRSVTTGLLDAGISGCEDFVAEYLIASDWCSCHGSWLLGTSVETSLLPKGIHERENEET